VLSRGAVSDDDSGMAQRPSRPNKIPSPSSRRVTAPWRNRGRPRGSSPLTLPPAVTPSVPERPDAPGTTGQEVPGQPGLDQGRNVRKAQSRFNKSLDELEKALPDLSDEKIEGVVRGAVERVRHELEMLVMQGAGATPSQVLFVVLISKESEDEIQASEDGASDKDKKILQGIEKQLKKANVPFWEALASLGTVKEWSASLEISAGFFAVKGTGGISVTFGK
jgi:hypothetical protein